MSPPYRQASNFFERRPGLGKKLRTYFLRHYQINIRLNFQISGAFEPAEAFLFLVDKWPHLIYLLPF